MYEKMRSTTSLLKSQKFGFVIQYEAITSKIPTIRIECWND